MSERKASGEMCEKRLRDDRLGECMQRVKLLAETWLVAEREGRAIPAAVMMREIADTAQAALYSASLSEWAAMSACSTCVDEVRSALGKRAAAPAAGEPLTNCAAGKDGECFDARCPQNRDGEPMKSGRNCPLPGWG